MADIVVKLTSATFPNTVYFAFGNYEVPEKITFGGEQRLAVHALVGGGQVVDALGRDERELAWSGVFIGEAALQRARYVDGLRLAGKALSLTWSEFSYTVVIKSFTCAFERSYKLPYDIRCQVVQDNTQPVTSAPALSVDDALTADANNATSLASSINDGVLSAAVAKLSSAISSVSHFTQASQSMINPILQTLEQARSRVQILLASSANTLINTSTLGGILSTPKGLQDKVNQATQLAALYNLDSTLGRMGGNLAAVNTTQTANPTQGEVKAGMSNARTVTVSGGNLYALAAQYYGDAKQWVVIAQANNLTDPQLTGVQTLLIPPAPAATGGVGNA